MSISFQEEIRKRNLIVIIFGIITASILIRIYFYPFDLPITHDGDYYFSYAIDFTILGKIPDDYTLPNNGWPMLLSFLFSIFDFNSAQEYMNLQRVLSMSISVLTIIPVYFICRKFFPPIISIIGASFFAFSPQIIQNSILGITEPLFICLIAISILFFLDKKINFVYYSFWILAIASIVRYEGIILLIPFSIMFFIKFRNKQKIIPKIKKYR